MACCGGRVKAEKRTFNPDFRGKPLTEKFYARHEHLDFGKESDLIGYDNVAYYMDEILKRLKYDPREHSSGPISENQTYGWFEHKAIRYRDKRDLDLVFYPRKVDKMMRILMEISIDLKRERRFRTLAPL